MLPLLLFSISISLSTTIILIQTPLILGMWLLMMASFISISLSTLSSSWFGFILFLIYIGGLLVMFAYFSALSPNQQMNMNLPLIMMMLSLLLFMSYMYKYMIMMNNLSTMTLSSKQMFFLFTYNNSSMIIFLAILLFLALIVVCKITLQSKGPMRPFG